MTRNRPSNRRAHETIAIEHEGQRYKIGAHYVCGCGGVLWILAKNGDCICADCRRAQARIIVNELAPVEQLGK